MECNDLSYEDIVGGSVYSFNRVITKKDLDTFVKLTQDTNPLHTDEEYAKTTMFNGRIVHGMLAGSLFSTLVGMVCPGKRNLYLSQTLKFKKPVKVGDTLTIRGTIVQKMDTFKLIKIKTEILIHNNVVINGEAQVKVI